MDIHGRQVRLGDRLCVGGEKIGEKVEKVVFAEVTLTCRNFEGLNTR